MLHDELTDRWAQLILQGLYVHKLAESKEFGGQKICVRKRLPNSNKTERVTGLGIVLGKTEKGNGRRKEEKGGGGGGVEGAINTLIAH